MAISFKELSHLVDRSIIRVPDAQSRLDRDTAYFCRKAFAGELASAMGAKHVYNFAILLTLPFQLCLLTDPHLFQVKNGHLILDHPTVANDGHEHWFDRCAPLDTRHSLYQNRYPRLIALEGAGKERPVDLSFYVSNIWRSNHMGLFSLLDPKVTQ